MNPTTYSLIAALCAVVALSSAFVALTCATSSWLKKSTVAGLRDQLEGLDRTLVSLTAAHKKLNARVVMRDWRENADGDPERTTPGMATRQTRAANGKLPDWRTHPDEYIAAAETKLGLRKGL